MLGLDLVRLVERAMLRLTHEIEWGILDSEQEFTITVTSVVRVRESVFEEAFFTTVETDVDAERRCGASEEERS